MFELILAKIGLVAFILYTSFFFVINGNKTLESISSTSYISKEKFGTTLPFTLICVICSVCLFPLWVAVSPAYYQFLVFISCLGVMFAGSTPFFKQEFEGKIHYTSGIMAFIGGLTWLLVTSNWPTALAIGLICGIWT